MTQNPKNPVGEPVLGSHNGDAPFGVRRAPDAVSVAKQFSTEQAGFLPKMDRFFGTKERTFWTFQAVGWFGYGLVRMFTATTLGFDLRFYSMMVIATIVIGVTMTIGLRYVYRIIRDIRLPLLMVITLLLCGSLGLLFSSLEAQLGPVLLPGWVPVTGLAQFGNAVFEATVLFAWSAIYFGYHYYVSLQEQKEQVLKATAMAHQAQLKMLRYQLNPHFLFNTLNAISTLVLEKEEADANRMLTKLSSFLRYTLVNQPTQRIPLEQELQALSLYLDIEKVRFQDRLVLEFDIDERAKSALVPSLILQPLVENAIKYAIAPSIDGGTIKVGAEIVDDRLLLVLSDNGPGIEDLNNIVSKSGSGVGIVNTKERLQQIYNEEHTVTLKNLEPQGLGIYIEIPCERKENT